MISLKALFAKRRLQKARLAQRKIDSERARRGHSTRIHRQYARDPIIKQFKGGIQA